MAADFYTILTNAGIAYETAAKAAGTPIKLARMSVGDGGGAAYNPDATATALKREVWRGDINALIQDKSNPNWLVAELVIPDDVGGWTVREAGIWTDTGILYAIIKYPESFKPILSTGAGKEFYVRAIFQTSNAPNVTLLVDESIVKATRAWVVDYVAAELAKLDWKKSVRAIATTPITLSGAQTVDAVVLVAGDRVLAAGQAAARENGIYIVANGPWVRAEDANLSIEVTPNLLVLVEEGTAYSDSAWQLVTNGAIVLGTTALTFEMAFGRTGVAAGTYKQVTVNKNGLVMAGSNPTTLAGFGIQDAFTKTETAKAVSDAMAALVAASPAALDTLNELAAALGNDPNFAATITGSLALKAPLASPVFTGDPKAPTPAATDNDASISTTAFVRLAMALFGIGTDSAALVTDANNIPLGGIFRIASDGANIPVPANGIVINARYNDGGVLQIFSALAGTGGTPRIFWRTQAAQGFTPGWREFAGTDSPAFTGTPTAPTPAVTDASSKIATMQALWNVLGTCNIGALAPVALTLNANIDWAKPGGWSGFINVTATKAKGVTVPADAGGGSPAYGMWCITGRRDNSNGYTGIFTDYGSGRTWTGSCVVGADGPTFAELVRPDSPVFTGTPKGPTPDTNTAGNQLVTQDFVRAWARKFIGVGVGIPGSTYVVSPAQNGCWFNITLPNAIVALPAAANVPDGTTFLFRNNAGNATVTLTVPSGNILTDVNGLTLTLGRHEMIELASSGTSYWAVKRSLMAPAARLDGPAFIGNPTAPTPAPGDASGSLATTAFVRSVTGDTVGMVAHFAMSTPPDGWLKRNGAAVSRTNYAALFAKIGTLYGAGDGSTTFNLPDSRGHFDRGWDDGRNVDTGRVFGSGQAFQNASHNHTATTSTAGSHTHTSAVMLDRAPPGDGNAVYGDENYYGQGVIGTNAAGDHTHGVTVASSGGNESRPVNTAFLACIKY